MNGSQRLWSARALLPSALGVLLVPAAAGYGYFAPALSFDAVAHSVMTVK